MEHFIYDFEDIPDDIRVCVCCLEFIDFNRKSKIYCSNKCRKKYTYDNKNKEDKTFYIRRECKWRAIRRLKNRLEDNKIDLDQYKNYIEKINKKYGS